MEESIQPSQELNSGGEGSRRSLHPAGIDLTQFVDDYGSPICLKFHGYIPHNFKKVPPGTCRWRSECHLSHKAASVSTLEQLEVLYEEYILQQKEREVKEDSHTSRLLQKPLPTWLDECRQHLQFSTRGSSFEDMRNAVTLLLASTWTSDMKENMVSTLTGDGTCQDHPPTLPLHLLHLAPNPLSTAHIPICPALIHGFRLNGRKLPQNWTAVYKMTKKMVHKMQRTKVYEKYFSAYKSFIREIIAPLFASYTKSIIYQCPPTLRVHMPGHSPTIRMHCDAEYDRHESAEINFWIPFTEVFDSNTLWCESSPGKGDFMPFALHPGEGMRFNGNTCRHFTKPNVTEITRVSIDFRVIPADVAVQPKDWRGKIGDYPTEEMSCEGAYSCSLNAHDHAKKMATHK